MKYDSKAGPSIAIAFVLLVMFLGHYAFAGETRRWEVAPFVDFNGTVHGGFGDRYDGMSGSAGIGFEALLVVSDRMAVGAVAKTSAIYDLYNYPSGGDVMDEYGVWTASAGAIAYLGDMLYFSAMLQCNLDVFYGSTYVHDGSSDTEIEKSDYTVDDTDGWFELGFRVDYRAAVYVAANTHLVETGRNTAKYHVYLGLKFFFY